MFLVWATFAACLLHAAWTQVNSIQTSFDNVEQNHIEFQNENTKVSGP